MELRRQALLAAVMAAGFLPTSQAQVSSERLPLPSTRERQSQLFRALVETLGMVWDSPARGEGIVVQRVSGGGPASVAGLRAGDVVRVVNGKAIRTLADWNNALVGGKRLAIQYERAGRMWNTVLDVPAVQPPLRAGVGQPAAPRVRPTLGVTVRAVGNRERLELGIPQDVSGLLVTRLQPGSPAAREGIPLGCVILQVGDVLMREPDDLIALVRAARVGQTLEIRYWHRGQVWRKRVALAPEVMVPQSVLDLERQLESPGAADPEQKVNEIAELQAKVAALEKELAEVRARLARLEAQLDPKTSNNAGSSESLPPASNRDGG